MATYCQVQETIEVLQGLYIPDVTGLAFSLLGSSQYIYIFLSDHWVIWRGRFFKHYTGSQRKTDHNIIGIYNWPIL